MFTDEPSPFKPPGDSGRAVVALVLVALGAFGAYTYVTRTTERREVRPEPPKSAPNPVQQNRSEGSTRRPTPSVPVAPSPESVLPRVASGNTGAPARITIYLCKAYSGGSFWSDTTCSSQRATIDRMTTVPASLSFQQQVAVARGEAREAAMLHEPPQPIRATSIRADAPPLTRSSMCDTYDRQVQDLDAEARRPLPPSRQDQIRAVRMDVMAARFRERC